MSVHTAKRRLAPADIKLSDKELEKEALIHE